MNILILTGYSGAGKSSALRYLEESGFYCVDNLPASLLRDFIASVAKHRRDKVAVVIDARGRGFLRGLEPTLESLKTAHHLSLVFFESEIGAVTKRFQEHRLRHPLALKGTIRQGYETEKRLLSGLRQRADLVVDTTAMSVHSLRALIHKSLARDSGREMEVHFMSFGFKYGLPPEADIVLDARLLPNPYFQPGLRRKSGKSPAVARFILRHGGVSRYLAATVSYLRGILSGYAAQGKPFVTIAVGCTGGRHRSVYVAERLAKTLKSARSRTKIKVSHRDIRLG